MLLELTRWLQDLQSFFSLFGYLTFRGILSALTFDYEWALITQLTSCRAVSRNS